MGRTRIAVGLGGGGDEGPKTPGGQAGIPSLRDVLRTFLGRPQ